MGTFNYRNYIKTFAAKRRQQNDDENDAAAAFLAQNDPTAAPVTPQAPTPTGSPVAAPAAPVATAPTAAPAPQGLTKRQVAERIRNWLVSQIDAVTQTKQLPPPTNPLWLSDTPLADGTPYKQVFTDIANYYLDSQGIPDAEQIVSNCVNGTSAAPSAPTQPTETAKPSVMTEAGNKFTEYFGQEIMDSIARQGQFKGFESNANLSGDAMSDSLMKAFGLVQSKRGNIGKGGAEKLYNRGLLFLAIPQFSQKYLPPQAQQYILQNAGAGGTPTDADSLAAQLKGTNAEATKPRVAKIMEKYDAENGGVLSGILGHLMDFAAQQNPQLVEAAKQAVPQLANMSPDEVKKDLIGWGQGFVASVMKSRMKGGPQGNTVSLDPGSTKGGEEKGSIGDNIGTMDAEYDPEKQEAVKSAVQNLPVLAKEIRNLGKDLRRFIAGSPNYSPAPEDRPNLGKDVLHTMENPNFGVGRKTKNWPNGVPQYNTSPKNKVRADQAYAYAASIASSLDAIAKNPMEIEKFMPKSKPRPAAKQKPSTPVDPNDPLGLNSVQTEPAQDPNAIIDPLGNPTGPQKTKRVTNDSKEHSLPPLAQDEPNLHSMQNDPNYARYAQEYGMFNQYVDEQKSGDSNSMFGQFGGSAGGLKRLLKNENFIKTLDSVSKQRAMLYQKNEVANGNLSLHDTKNGGIYQLMAQQFPKVAAFLTLPEVRDKYDLEVIRLFTDAWPVRPNLIRGEGKGTADGLYSLLWHAVRGELSKAPQMTSSHPDAQHNIKSALDKIKQVQDWASGNRHLPASMKPLQRLQAEVSAQLKKLYAIRNRMDNIKVASATIAVFNDAIKAAENRLAHIEGMMDEILGLDLG